MATRRSCSRQGVSVVLPGLTPMGGERDGERGRHRASGRGGVEVGQVQSRNRSHCHSHMPDRGLAVGRRAAREKSSLINIVRGKAACVLHTGGASPCPKGWSAGGALEKSLWRAPASLPPPFPGRVPTIRFRQTSWLGWLFEYGPKWELLGLVPRAPQQLDACAPWLSGSWGSVS